MSTSETSEHGGIASQYIYFRRVSCSHMLPAFLNWFMGRLSSYDVFFGYFSIRLQSLNVAQVSLLYISLNLIGFKNLVDQSGGGNVK